MAIGRTNACVSSGSGSNENYKKLLDGSLTEFSTLESGATSLEPYRFYNFKNLASANFTSISVIPNYTCQGCTALNSIVLDSSTTDIGDYAFNGCTTLASSLNLQNNVNVGSYAFSNTKINSIQGNFKSLKSYSFSSNTSLNNINIKIDGSLNDYSFNGDTNVYSFTLNSNSIITTLGSYAFGNFGRLRQNPENNVFVFDFRNSTFSSVGSYCFSGSSSSSKSSYFDIKFPTTLNTINNYVFQYSDNYNIYYSSVPTLSSTNVFNSATNFKNFFPYNLVQTAKTSTNWASTTNGIVNSIYGYSAENTFTQGETLPLSDSDGYSLTWYSDPDFATQVTTVENPSQVYYCKVGARIFVKISKISQYQATCTVSDGTKTYTQGDLILIGTSLTITATGEGENTQVYQFTLNGTNITSGYEYTVAEDDISIVCIYWDGVNVPVNPTFSENTPAQIKVGIDTGVGKDLWTSGDTIPITLTNGSQCNLVLYDLKQNRYEKSDGSGYSNGVLGFEEVTTIAQMNTTSTNVGGWSESHMKTVTMEEVYNLLPDDWKAVVSEVKVASTVGDGSTAISYSDNKTFVPACVEVGVFTTSSGYKDEGTIFDYFVGTSGSAEPKRVKKNLSGTISSYWLRSPGVTYSNLFINIYASGDWSTYFAYSTSGVSACFAI